MIRLLIVDDSPLMRRLMTDIFVEAGDFEIELARYAEEALTKLVSFLPDVITLDINMPGMDGLACLDRIMVERPTPVVMVSTLTAAGADETLEALALGAIDFVPKPQGALSLEIDAVTHLLLEKVRSAASARIPPSARLTERVRRRRQLSSLAGAVKPRADVRVPAIKPFATIPDATRRQSSATLSTTKLAGVEAVLVGVSTGGPPALDTLLQPLPAGFPWPIVIAQHMPGSFTGPLARRLDRTCSLIVSEVGKPVPLQPGHVYIGRGDADLVLARRAGQMQVLAAPMQTERLWHPSADRLVESARSVFEAPALVAVLMTGMGSDGAATMAKLHDDGGHVIAQDEASSVVWGMPGTLVAANGADVVLPLDLIARQLIAWAL